MTSEAHGTALEIRAAQGKDLAAVVRLWEQLNRMHEVYSPAWRTADEAPELFRSGLERGLTSGQVLLIVAVEEDEVIGYCHAIVKINTRLLGERTVGTIVSICVDPGRRSRGAGARLIEACLDLFRVKGIERVETLVSNRNERALKFWDDVGFLPHARVLSSSTLHRPVRR